MSRSEHVFFLFLFFLLVLNGGSLLYSDCKIANCKILTAGPDNGAQKTHQAVQSICPESKTIFFLTDRMKMYELNKLRTNDLVKEGRMRVCLLFTYITCLFNICLFNIGSSQFPHVQILHGKTQEALDP